MQQNIIVDHCSQRVEFVLDMLMARTAISSVERHTAIDTVAISTGS